MNKLSQDGRALFKGARADFGPREADRLRVGRALGVKLIAAAGAGTAATATGAKAAAAGLGVGGAGASSAFFGSIQWLLGGVFLVALGIGGFAAYRAREPGPRPIAPVAAEAPPLASTAPVEETAVNALPVPTSDVPIASSSAPEVAVPAPVHARGASVPNQASGKDSVADEARLLRDADAALRGGDADGALALLDQHKSAHPNGVLSEEMAAERVFTLCKMGRVADARQKANQFLQAHPKSPQAKGIRESCAFAKP